MQHHLRNVSLGTFQTVCCLDTGSPKIYNSKTKVNDSMNTLLIYEGGKVIEREPIRIMSPGCRYCKGYFFYEMS